MDVALITLHGMGKYKPSYYDELEDKLKKLLKEKWSQVSFQNVQFGPIFQEQEDLIWEKMNKNPENKLDCKILRELFLFGFADAASFEHNAQRNKNEYNQVQEEIKKALKHTLVDFEGDTKKPIIIIAQSLGCQVISNYLWDSQNKLGVFEGSFGNQKEEANFYSLKSLSNLITTGCNIPLFVAGLKERKCFTKPNESFAWDNFYNPNDILGWPLKQLDNSYSFVNDHPTFSGGIFTSWNISSHGEYWSDNKIVSHLKEILLSKIPTT